MLVGNITVYLLLNQINIDMNISRNQSRILERYLNKNKSELANITKEDLLDLFEKIILKNEQNFILLSDGYKYSHHKFYTPGLTKLTSYMESRGGKFKETVFFGLQYILKKYFVGKVISQEMIDEAFEKLQGKDGVFGPEGSFSKEKWESLLKKHDGYLPLRIKAVPEGTVVTTKNILMLIESTDDEFAWLTGFVESILLQVWYPITVATLSREVKKIVKHYLKITGCDPATIDIVAEFILNDFGFRGVSSVESASIGGAAHLVNFMGSDNTVGSDMLIDYYNTNIMWGKSIDATEHSICTMEGEKGEIDVFRRVLLSKPKGIVACVSDSFNILRACMKYWGEDLKDIILARDGVLVIRPDSGHVIMTLKKVFEILFDKFGYTINSKGFKVLPPQVRVIQGDGVNLDSINEIYEELMKEGIAAENLVLGMGGKLLQAGIDRDTCNFAIKACNAIINGNSFDIEKSPTEIDENGEIHASFKKSKKGIPKLVKTEINFKTLTNIHEGYDEAIDELVPVFENGFLLQDYKFENIRNLAKVV